MSSAASALEATAAEVSARDASPPLTCSENTCGLSDAAYLRYGRQIILPAFGASSQAVLSSLSVLIVGAGGLGCPVALYLAAAGVGQLTIVDHDTVDASNLHRQIGHAEARVGQSKAASLAATCRGLNSGVAVMPVAARFGPDNGLQLVSSHDVIVDATDNPGTRYLVNDAAVLCGKPLVSAAAVSTDGQLSVYGWRGGPCYRCVVPLPPPAAAVTTCADAGVLGPIVGVMGSLQALEVMKIAAAIARDKIAATAAAEAAPAPAPAADGPAASPAAVATTPAPQSLLDPPYVPSLEEPLAGRMLLFDGSDSRFRLFSLRSRAPDCALCGPHPSIRSLADSAAWCAQHGVATSDAPMLPPPPATSTSTAAVAVDSSDARADASCECVADKAALAADAAAAAVPSVSVAALAAARRGHAAPVILDVRPAVQFAIASLRGSRCLPLSVLQHRPAEALACVQQLLPAPAPGPAAPAPVYVLCRRGIDSRVATALLRGAGVEAVNVSGGLQAWSRGVDPSFPLY